MSSNHEEDDEPTIRHPDLFASVEDASWFQPHAFHVNLPPHFMLDPPNTRSDNNGEQNDSKIIPGVTIFAMRKARQILELAHSIQLHESMFTVNENRSVESTSENLDVAMEEAFDINSNMDDDDNAEMDTEDDNADAGAENIDIGLERTSTLPSLLAVQRKCSRLQSQISGLENLKCGGMSQMELCTMFLHLLSLVTATVSYENNPAEELSSRGDESTRIGDIEISVGTLKGKPKLNFENVGRILHFSIGEEDVEVSESGYGLADSEETLDEEIRQEFALPSPSREVLLLILINMLSKKGPLRSVSNASLYLDGEDHKSRSLLILEWKPLLRMLLRTAPYLDEHKPSKCPVKNSNSRHSTLVKRSVQLIRDARHFFEQGVRPPGYRLSSRSGDMHACIEDVSMSDKTSREVWDMPSRCSAAYYQEVLPLWWSAWTNIDRCPEYDFLWLTLFCRARKYVSPENYDWSPIRQRLLTHCQYWLQLPIGGTSMDKSFPRAASPRSRSCPPRLKVFAGTNSSYEEGIDFVAKVTKLLVSSLGAGKLIKQGNIHLTEGTNDILRFLSFVTPYFNPSNLGSWTFALGAFLHYFVYELSCRIGAAASQKSLASSKPLLVKASNKAKPGAFCQPIPAVEVVALMDALLPICKQALYSKNGHVGRAGEAAMLYLVQIDPDHSAPAFVDFAISALDIAAVNLSHQAPAALSALTRLIQPALRSDPTILLTRLPEILRLSLAGIDSNDQNKTIRTLVLYRSLTSWIPVGGNPEDWKTVSLNNGREVMTTADGTMRLGFSLYDTLQSLRRTHDYLDAVHRLPPTSLMKQGISGENDKGSYDDMYRLLLEEGASAMSDWSIEFLDRIFGLLRASGEREKTGKNSSAVASRHSNADVHHARNFSRVLKECLIQLFAAMDDKTHALAVRSVTRFLQEESLPAASKDASLLCQAVAAARAINSTSSEPDVVAETSPGLNSLIGILTDDLLHHSTKTLSYRLRCLAGAVRHASHGVLKHKSLIASAIEFALSSEDRHLFKTGCKLLRHTLSTLTESYPLPSDNCPRAHFQVCSGSGSTDTHSVMLGRSAQLNGDPIKWHVPNRESIDFAWMLLKSHVVSRLDDLSSDIGDNTNSTTVRSKLLNCVEVNELRRCLRVIRYAIRGGATVFLENVAEIAAADAPNSWGDFVPYEKAVLTVVNSASQEAREGLALIRGRICSFVVVLSSILASDTLHPDAITKLHENDPYRKMIPLISSDPKVCKETSDISLLLLTRRGASFRSQEARTIWKAQKQLASDFILSSQVDHIAELVQSAGLSEDPKTLLYKDGEDGGKTLPRRLLVARVQLFHDSLQRHASFEVPRRLRRQETRNSVTKVRLFSVKSSLPGMLENLENVLRTPPPHPLDAYEGMADGLYALCCHSNTEMRASAISVIDYALTRFGWMVAPRVPRLLSALALQDKNLNGKFGVPSCFDLVQNVNQQGKRKRLAEAVKGICSILSLSRSIKVVLQTEKMRWTFAKTICGTDSLISLLPTEEMQKLVHYFQAVFSPFRSKIYYQPRTSKSDLQSHMATMVYALDNLSEKKTELDLTSEAGERGAAHWRKLLISCWFLMTIVDEDDFLLTRNPLIGRTWATCFRIIETETGQPLQRVALGLLGRLLSICEQYDFRSSLLREKMASQSFCKLLVDGIVFDHKEDTSVGGGHHAQWATGVEDIIRDAARNVAPRTLFPFQRTSQALGSFKASHSQLVESLLLVLDKDTATVAAKCLLSLSKELASAPPSEDQRNQQISSAEIVAGVCGSFLRRKEGTYTFGWDDTLLPLFEEIVIKVPFSLTAAYFDTIRFTLQFCPASSFFPLTRWIVEKIKSSLWQPTSENDELGLCDPVSQIVGNTQGSEGFTAQSKWLYLFTAVIIEIDESEASSLAKPTWYVQQLVANFRSESASSQQLGDIEESWQLVFENLLPRLIGALGHPFDSCRDHISRCLFRICYCHRKRTRVNASRAPSRANSLLNLEDYAAKFAKEDPGSVVVDKLASLISCDGCSFNDRYNALGTARRFMSYSVHLGEAKFEYSDYVIPLLSLAFESLKSTVEDEIGSDLNSNPEENAAKRALEAEVIKGFRFALAEISISAIVSYGKESDIDKVLNIVRNACRHNTWQVRHAGIHFLRCFEGAHKFLFTSTQAALAMEIVASLLGDDRREVSSAAMSALTGILAALPPEDVSQLVKKYAAIAGKSRMKRQKLSPKGKEDLSKPITDHGTDSEKENIRALSQKTSVFFLCAAIMAQPYDTPSYIPVALAAISKHSFERNAPLGVRDTVKRCCAEYKRTHMSDNWDLHRAAFTQEQLEALEDVVSSPHYYA